MEPADENDVPIFEGRCNLGAISLHLPMILAKAREENKDFYEVLDYYLELIRKLHKKTYAYLAEKKASTNPLMFMQGGLLGGNLKANDNSGTGLKFSNKNVFIPFAFNIKAVCKLNSLDILLESYEITTPFFSVPCFNMYSSRTNK